MKQALLVFLTAGLLVFVACSDGDDSPLATDTPAIEATATIAPATATVPAEPTATTEPPDVESPCPAGDPALCSFAEAFDRALRLGQFDAVIGNTELASQTCSGLEQVGRCVGLAEGAEISGYLVGIDASDAIFYMSGAEYLAVLQDIAQTDDAAVDEYGDGAWRLVALVDEGPDMKVLVTTSIGPDPIYSDAEPARRVFLFRVQRTDAVWQVSILLTTVFVEANLTGLWPNGEPFVGWLPWGE